MATQTTGTNGEGAGREPGRTKARGGKNDVADAAKGAVTISPANLLIAEFEVIGETPLVMNAWGHKIDGMIENQRDPRNKNRKKKPRDFAADYENAKHISTDGWIGLPAAAFRAAMISACRIAGYAMTRAKLSAFVLADGVDRLDGVGLVRVYGEPRPMTHPVRNESGVADVRSRPMWDEWRVKLRVRYDADQFSVADVANLLNRAGLQVGVGEGRNDSKKSAGVGWGSFRLA